MLLTLAMLITACTAFPIGPKRSFRNWEEDEPQVTVTPQNTYIPNTTATQVLTEPAEEPVLPDASAATEDATSIEYEFPPPMPFELGQTQTEFGIQINGCDQDVPAALAVAKRMGLTWIKQQARWGDIEKAPGQFDWACLDRVIPEANAQGFKVLVSVTSAAPHTRQIYKGIFHPTNGRPADLRDFGLFLA
ncbi:MAG: hypothetical protein HC853_18375 [Anaerolineae bacterium]|nr:hypothetical protein [Anaerolineae bacterium]